MELLALALTEILTHNVIPILMFLVGLGVVIFVHELGHFVMARLVGIRVETFALGMGPRLFGVRGKETDYCVRLVPLGGYVKMAGQEDFGPLKDEDKDPRSFVNKTVGQRMGVIAAGVIMNVIFAALGFVVVGLIGINFPAPVIGHVEPGFPAAETAIVWQAPPEGQPEETTGLVPGDRILSINGSAVHRFDRIMYASMLARDGEQFEIEVARPLDGATILGVAQIGVMKGASPSGEDSKVFQFGVGPADTLVLASPEGATFGDDGFAAGQRVLAIDGETIEDPWQIDTIEADLTGKPVTVTVALADDPQTTKDVLVQPRLITGNEAYAVAITTDGQLRRVTGIDPVLDDEGESVAPPQLRLTLWSEAEDPEAEPVTQRIDADDLTESMLDVLGMTPRFRFGAIYDDSPAEDAALLPGDVVISYGGQHLPSLAEFLQANRDAMDGGTQIIVLRDGITEGPIDITPDEENGRAIIGTRPDIDQEHLVVGYVRPGSAADRAGITRGCLIQTVNGQSVATWPELIAVLAAGGDEPINLTGVNGSQPFEADLGPLADTDFSADDYAYRIFPFRRFQPLEVTIRFSNPLAAIEWGSQETYFLIRMDYANIRALFGRTVSAKELRGPVGIAEVAVKVARQSGIRFVYFMAMLSVFVAVCNFLPLPVLDGGHAVFLIIEKVRGKPLSAKVMNAIQVVGLVLLLGLVLLVTWRDILRIINDW